MGGGVGVGGGGVGVPGAVTLTVYSRYAEPTLLTQSSINLVVAVSGPTFLLLAMALVPFQRVLLGVLEPRQLVALVVVQRKVTGVPEITLAPWSELKLVMVGFGGGEGAC